MPLEFLQQATAISAGAVLLVHEALKLMPLSFTNFANKFPVPTNIVLSVLATIFIVKPTWSWDNMQDIAVTIGLIAVGAALAFNQLFANWKSLRTAEARAVAKSKEQ